LELAILLSLAVISDVKSGKVRNKLNYSFIAAGIITNLAIGGRSGLIFSLWGIILPLMCLLVLFLLRMLGAGDIKLLCALGSIMGAEFAGSVMLYSFAAGGIAAAAAMMLRKNCSMRAKYFVDYAVSCFLTMSFLPYSDFGDKQGCGRFHFAGAIAFGAVLAVYLPVLGKGAAWWEGLIW